MSERYWLTPPGVYGPLDQEFHFDFDPCPYPKPDNWDALNMDWGNMNFVNPPFRKHDGNGFGPTAFVRKAIQEQAAGRSSVILVPVQSYVNLLLEAGAELRSAGRVRWLEAETGKPCTDPSPIVCAVLRAAVRPRGGGAMKGDREMIIQSDAEILAGIKEALTGLKSGTLTPESFVIVVASMVDPIQPTKEDMKWAHKKLEEIRHGGG